MHRPKNIVILGAGFAGVYAFLELHKQYHRDPSVTITIINRTDYFLFTPLLHEVATGGVSSENLTYNIHSILTCCLGKFIEADVRRIDLEKKIVATSKENVSYDVLLYALGAEINFFGLSKEAQKHVVPLKTLRDAKNIKTRLIELFEQDEHPAIVIVGGGPTGVEVASEVREYCDELARAFYKNKKHVSKITVIDGHDRLLTQFHPKLGQRAKDILQKRKIRIMLKGHVHDVTEKEVIMKNGERIPAHLVIWAAGVTATKISTSPEIPRDQKNRIIVTPTLQLNAYPEVFVVGDSAGIPDGKKSNFRASRYDSVPMTAQAAVRAGKKAARNIRAFLNAEPLTPFAYRHKGDLFSLGQWMAGAEIFGVRFFGHFAWWLWRTIYLSKIIGFRNKVNVAVDWTLNLFLSRDMTKNGEKNEGLTDE